MPKPIDLDELLRLSKSATRLPWSASFWKDRHAGSEGELIDDMFCEFAEANAAELIQHNPSPVLYCTAEEEPEGPIFIPDQTVYIASKRTVNCGYDMVSGDTPSAQDVYLRPADAVYIAAACNAVPELITKIRELEAALSQKPSL